MATIRAVIASHRDGVAEMIPKYEIVAVATQASLQTHVIEKDYALGWVLAGISQSAAINSTWVFKGGTCLKKCYFETYRFSEDLDFTLRDPTHINAEFLHATFAEISNWIYEQSGLEIPADRMKFEVYTNPRGVASCQGRVYYKGPATFSGKHSMPRIKLDLSSDEILVDPPVNIPVRHDYSDRPASGFSVQAYSYAEVFAEKIRALKERTRPRDLYDVINFFRRPESAEVANDVRAILTEKCLFKQIEFPVLADLDQHKDVCAAGWSDQLSHQLQSLPPFEAFWGELPSFFAWLADTAAELTTHLSAIPLLGVNDAVAASLVSGSPEFSSLDRVRFGAVNRLCVQLDYRKENGQRVSYLIEPYALRITAAGNTLLYGVKLPTEEVRCFRTDRIIGASVANQVFTPRYSIDFIPEGPVHLNVRRLTATSIPSKHPSPHALLPPAARTSHSRSGRTYVYKCPVCNKQFTRTKQNATLNPHKNMRGQPCYGRAGIFVRTKF